MVIAIHNMQHYIRFQMRQVQEALEKIICSFYEVFSEYVTGQSSHLQIRDV